MGKFWPDLHKVCAFNFAEMDKSRRVGHDPESVKLVFLRFKHNIFLTGLRSKCLKHRKAKRSEFPFNYLFVK